MMQTAFAFDPVTTDYLREDFLISDANRDGVDWIDRWPEWPAYGLILYGPEASGKTHLASIWAQETKAVFIKPENIGKMTSESLLRGGSNAVIDGLEQLKDEEGLFHLLNYMKEADGALLMTTNAMLQQHNYRLPDLYSRIAAFPFVKLQPPDDALISALLRRQFSDRQLAVGDDVIAWLLPRMERSFVQVRNIADQLDIASLRGGRAITIPFARKVTCSAVCDKES